MSELQPEVYNSDDRGPSVVRLCIAFMVIPVVATALRFWSRSVSGGPKSPATVRFWWDDWFALITLPFAVGLSAIGIYWTTIGLGKHITEVPLSDITKGLKLFFAGYIVYNFGVTLSKISALAFYARVFSPNNNRRFLLELQLTALFTMILWFITLMVDIFQCTPVQKAWLPSIDGHCIDTWKWWLGFGVLSITLDVWILLLPLPILWGLQLEWTRKIFVTAMFVCGYCVVVISIGRVIAVKNVSSKLATDVDYALVPVVYWLIAEMSISVLSICLPSIFILCKRCVQHGFWSLFTREIIPGQAPTMRYVLSVTRGLRNKPANAFQSISFDNDFERLNDNPNHEYYAMACKGPSNAASLNNVELAAKSISVRREVNIVSESAQTLK